MEGMENELRLALTDAVIRRLAGEQAYRRGADYFTHGHVQSVEERGATVRSAVRGSDDYMVTLTAEDGVLNYSCDCPIGSDGEFCKHCVAAGLAWLNQANKTAKAPGRGKAKALTLDDVETILRAEGQETVIRMLLDWAKDDERLHDRLILYAARRSAPNGGADAVRRTFEKAVRVRGYLSYREAGAWARGVDDAIDSIEQMLNDGHPAAAVELCESALQALSTSIESVDDSDGHFSMLRDRLQELHYRACDEARPDPVDLAERLFQWELRSDFDVFYGAVERYAQFLGAEGMKVYRSLAETEWAKVPVQTGKQTRTEWGQHFRITHIMESLAKASGDIEELVGVMGRDLSSAYRYVRIAEVYRDAHQDDKALAWAEKGLQAFPERADSRLREFAAQEYHRRGRHGDAMKLIWSEFSERLYLETYKTLEKHAKTAGAWPEWRERALAEIRVRIASLREKVRGRSAPRWAEGETDNSTLVEIFLHEGNPEEAWREAETGGCSDRLWLQLAEAVEEKHPEEAAPVYLRLAEAAVTEARKSRYEEPVRLLVQAAELMRRMDRSQEFIQHLEALRVKHKIKRNLIKEIEQKRKWLYFKTT